MDYRKTTVEKQDSSLAGLERIRPEMVMLQLESFKHPRDIGALAYSVREHGARTNDKVHLPYKVDESSLHESRRVFISNFLDRCHSGEWSDETVQDYYLRFSDIFEWMNNNGYEAFLDNIEESKKAYFNYSDYLRSGVKIGSLSPSYAYRYQNKARSIFKLAYTEDYKQVVTVTTTILPSKPDTEAPKKALVEFLNDRCLETFEEFTKKVLDNSPFPWYIEFNEFSFYVFPSTTVPFDTPYSMGKERKRVKAYDYENGVVLDKETLAERGINLTKHDHATTMRILDESNSDKFHNSRFRMAQIAQKAYHQLFAITTAANASTIADIRWDERYTLEKDYFKNSFGSLKARAGGKDVTYNLGRRGIALFKRYLKLRDYLLNGQECEYLFFGKQNLTSKVNKLNAGKFINRYYENARGILLPDDFKTLGTPEFRLFKSNDMHEHGEKLSTVASHLQHTEETEEQVYAKGNEENQANDFGQYWAAVLDVKISYDNGEEASLTSETEESIPSGHCESYNKPTPISDEVTIEPSCEKGQGCLFCKNYVCHADEEDVSKLLSLLYVVEKFREGFHDFESADALFRPLVVRIRLALDKIREKSDNLKGLVEHLEEEVLEMGMLTPFWEMKLQRYEELGVIASE